LQEARQNGCAQVLFLDAQEGRYLEELGGMNIFIVFKDGTLATPTLSDSILAGVTRASIIEIAKLLGHPVQERKISLQEVGDGLASGEITEVFACGTAAVIFPIALLKGRDFSHGRSDASAGPVTLQLRQQLTDIQFGHTPSPHPWMFRLD
jgi:branched-chain amino acid aminotransferase